MNILQINSSINGEAGASTRLANEITAGLAGEITLRDLADGSVPHLDGATFAAFQAEGAELSQAQARGLALSDQLIEEVRRADVLVIAMPLYNFGVPSSFKAWVDHIARAGVTFRYTSEGPEGLLGEKRVIIAAARGGQYAGTPADTQTAWLEQVLGFMGLGKPEFIYAEGLANPERREQVLAQLSREVQDLAA